MTNGNLIFWIILIFAFWVIPHCGCQESSPSDPERPARHSNTKSLIDGVKAKEVPLVLRVEMVKFHGGSKYHWATVNIVEVLKNTTDDLFTDKLKIAMRGTGKRLSHGESIIYLVRYNDEQPEHGWKLYEQENELARFRQIEQYMTEKEVKEILDGYEVVRGGSGVVIDRYKLRDQSVVEITYQNGGVTWVRHGDKFLVGPELQ